MDRVASRLKERIEASLDLSDFGVAGLEDVCRVVGASNAFFYEFFDKQPMAAMMVAERRPIPWDYMDRYFPTDPVGKLVWQPDAPAVFCVTDRISPQAMRRSAVFADVYEPQAMDHHLSMALSEPRFAGRYIGGIYLYRTKREATFDAAMVHRATEVARDLRGLAQRSGRMLQRRVTQSAVESLYDELLPKPVLLFSRVAVPLWLSPAARLWKEADPDGYSSLLHAVRRFGAESASSTLSLAGSTHAHAELRSRDREKQVVVTLNVQVPEELLLRRARQRGLSPAQALVMVQVARGLSSKEVARTLSLSEHTVRTHVRNVYDQLGVNSRVQALNRLFG